MKPKKYNLIPKVKLEYVDPKSLKPSEYNPKVRTSENKKMKLLKEAIIEYGGVVVPVLIADDRRIIDGHRRTKASIDLGLELIPVLIFNSTAKEMYDKYYIDIQNTTMPITAAQELEIFIKGGKITDKADRDINYLREIGGMRLLNELYKKGVGATSMAIGLRQLMNYTDDYRPSFLKKASKWCLMYSTMKLKMLLREKVNPDTLCAAINDLQPIEIEIS